MNANQELEKDKKKEELNSLIQEVTDSFLCKLSVEEQKYVLDNIKKSLSMNYENLRQQHLKSAEDYGLKIEIIQS